MAVASYFDTVQKIYIAFYQRPADPAGLYYWSQLLDINGGDLTAVIDGFANSAEAIRLYDKNADGAVNLDDASAMLDDVFMALFNRAPDPAGKQFYLDALTAGKFPDGRVATVGRVVLDVLNGATSADAIAVSNKLEYATAFTKTLDPELDGIGPFQATYNGDDEAGARTLLAAVTADPTTRKTAAQVAGEVQSGIADAGDPILNQQTTGQTFTLTAGADLFNTTTTTAANKTTAGDDKFFALTANYLDGSDIIDAGAGNDTLEALISNVNLTPLLTSVENLVITANVKSDDDATSSGNTSETTTLDISRATGVTSVAFKAVDTVKATFNGTNDATGVATLQGLSSTATTVSLANTSGGKTMSQDETLDINVVYNYAALTGASDTVTLTLNNTANADIVVKTDTGTVATGDKEGAETIALVSSTKASTIGTIASTKQNGSAGVLTSLQISGDADLTIGDAVNFATDSTKSVAATVTSTSTKKVTGTFNVANDNDAITVTAGNGGSAITVTSAGSSASSAVVSVTTGTGKDVVDVTDIGTRADDATTTTVNESQIVNVTVSTGAGDDTIQVNLGNVSITAGDGNDTLELTGITATQLDKYDTIDMGAGDDTVKTTDTTINASDKAQLARITGAEILHVTGTGAKVVELSSITGFTKATVDASGTISQTGTGAEAGKDAVTFKSENASGFITLAGAQIGQAGGTLSSTGTGGAGGVGVKISAKLDNGSNAATLVFVDNADVSGGAGGANTNSSSSASNVGGAGAIAIDATEYESVSIVLSGKDITKDTVTFAGGQGGAGGSGGSSGATATTGLKVGTNATITVTDTLAASASDGTALTDQYSSIEMGVIEGANVTVAAGTLRGSVKIDGVSGNTSITTGAGADDITGGSGIDTIVVGAGDDKIAGLGGGDVITIGDGNDVVVIAASGASTVSAYDSITGFTLASASWTGSTANDEVSEFQSTNAAGTNLNADLLDLATAGTLAVAGASASAGTTAASNVEVSATGKVTFAAADDTLAKKLVAVAADVSDIADNKAVFFEDSGNTYVFVNNSSNDVLVELVGVTGVAGLGLLASSGTVGGANYIMIV